MVEDEQRTDDAPVAADEAAPARTGRVWLVLPWVVVVLLAALAGGLFVALQGARAPQADRNAVEQAAGAFALNLTTWDASDGMADTRQLLQAAATERFAAEVDELFGGTGDLGDLEEIGARSSSEVEDVLVQSVDGDAAEALAVVVQSVTTDITEDAEVSLRYARLGLVRESGEWRIDRVELVVDALQQATERTGQLPAPDLGAGDEDGGGTDDGA